VGKVGDDPFGQAFIEALVREGIENFVARDPAIGTSLGIPMIDPNGDNSIIGIPRANTKLSREDVDAALPAIRDSDVLMLQLEVPLDTSQYAAHRLSEGGATVILNPAPAHIRVDELLPNGSPWIDWLIPNEVEAETLTGRQISNVASAREAAQALLSFGVRRGVAITMGAQGAFALTQDGEWHAPAFPVRPVDPTGAGDAFSGAFAVALAEGQPIESALRFANAAGALCVTVAGAEPSLPRREAIERLMKEDAASANRL
jgi:ribokinase